MWQVNYKYERDNTNTKCPLFEGSEDTKEFVLENYTASGFFQVFRNKQFRVLINYYSQVDCDCSNNIFCRYHPYLVYNVGNQSICLCVIELLKSSFTLQQDNVTYFFNNFIILNNSVGEQLALKRNRENDAFKSISCFLSTIFFNEVLKVWTVCSGAPLEDGRYETIVKCLTSTRYLSICKIY